jgi:carbamoyltransferase
MTTIVGLYSIPDISGDAYPTLIHDHNLTVVKNQNDWTYMHHERISRKKYDSNLPCTIEQLAKELDLVPAGDCCFVFVDYEIGATVLSKNGKIRFEAPLQTKLSEGLKKGRLYWMGEWKEAYVLNHELAHVFSCVPFYGMFRENSLLVHFDGGASKSNFSAWNWKDNHPQLIEAHYKHKWLSSLFNANALVFAMVQANIKQQNAVPGKFMGLEAYGNYRKDIDGWLRKNNFFEDCWNRKTAFFKAAKTAFGIEMKHIDNKNKFIQDVAATIHEIFLRESLKIFTELKHKTNATCLYYSGGTALNIKLNERILSSGLFTEVFIPPCTNDSGLSIGAAVAGLLHKNQPIPRMDPYLNNFRIENAAYPCSKKEVKKAADLIAKRAIIGICNGYAEAGPRALGNRSIIARADSKQLAKTVSQEKKQREWYRPVAPVMLARNFEYFTGKKQHPPIARYMLSEFQIIPDRRPEIAGCVHADGTSRIQVIEQRTGNPFMYALLDELEKSYGIRALINTSFNSQGKPIVHLPKEARSEARKMNLDALVINGKLEKINMDF